MCVTAAIIGSALIGGAATKYQTDKQMAEMEKQQKEAERLRKEQQAKFDLDKRKAEAVPTLLRNQAQKTKAKGLQGLKVSKSSSPSYSSVGTGGSSGTGINIPKG